jgi:hypothetical protein
MKVDDAHHPWLLEPQALERERARSVGLACHLAGGLLD